MMRGQKYNPGTERQKDSVSNADQWILYALGQLDGRLDRIDDRLDGIDKRLRWIERPLWAALAIVGLLAAILKL